MAISQKYIDEALKAGASIDDIEKILNQTGQSLNVQEATPSPVDTPYGKEFEGGDKGNIFDTTAKEAVATAIGKSGVGSLPREVKPVTFQDKLDESGRSYARAMEERKERKAASPRLGGIFMGTNEIDGLEVDTISNKTGVNKAREVVSDHETKQIKSFEEELKGMVRGSVADPKKDSQLMQVVSSIGKGLGASFEWTADQWKNMSPNSKQALISSLASAYMLSKGYKSAAGNVAKAGIEQMRYNDTLDLAKSKVKAAKEEKEAKAEKEYLVEKKKNLIDTATSYAVTAVADSSSFIKLTQEAGLIRGTNDMSEEDRKSLASALASEYKLQVNGGGIKQGSFSDYANNPEVVKAIMQKYASS